MLVNTAQECQHCQNGSTEDISKAVIKVHCSEKDRSFYYGQNLDCDDFTKFKEVKYEEDNANECK